MERTFGDRRIRFQSIEKNHATFDLFDRKWSRSSFIFLFFFFISLNNINVSRRNKRRNNVCVEVSRARPQRSFEAITRSIKIETFAVSSLNYRLINLISRHRFDLFPFLSFVRKLEKAWKKEDPDCECLAHFPGNDSKTKRRPSEIASVQILRTRHSRLAIFYDYRRKENVAF